MRIFSQAKARHDMSRGNGLGSGEVAATGKKPIEAISTIGPDMLVAGNIMSQGAAQILGKVMGDIQAVDVTIGDGAHVEGNITAQNIGIDGAFKGTIRGNTVKFRGAATVEGEVFTNSLAIEENVMFEGLSRRLDKSTDLPSKARANGEEVLVLKTDLGSPSQAGK